MFVHSSGHLPTVIDTSPTCLRWCSLAGNRQLDVMSPAWFCYALPVTLRLSLDSTNHTSTIDIASLIDASCSKDRLCRPRLAQQLHPR